MCRNSAKCEIFVAFMNQDWCVSQECMFELKIALTENLKTGTPYIIPILLEDFSEYKKYHFWCIFIFYFLVVHISVFHCMSSL
jgi:hypothetical protein